MYLTVLFAFLSGFCVLADRLEPELTTPGVPLSFAEENDLEEINPVISGLVSELSTTGVPPSLSEENNLEEITPVTFGPEPEPYLSQVTDFDEIDTMTTGLTDAVEEFLQETKDSPVVVSPYADETPKEIPEEEDAAAASPVGYIQITTARYGEKAREINLKSANVAEQEMSYFKSTTFYTEISALVEEPLERVVLEKPQLELCRNPIREVTLVDNSRAYYVSTKDLSLQYWNSTLGKYTTKHMSWLDAVNECRKRCLDLVSMETDEENFRMTTLMKFLRLPSIWTSGRRCDFTGCENYEDPRNVGKHSWIWTRTRQWIPVTLEKPDNWKSRPWSLTGIDGRPQPDNAEGGVAKNESCLAVLNNEFNDGIKWHDVACNYEKPFVCVGSKKLAAYAEELFNVTVKVF